MCVNEKINMLIKFMKIGYSFFFLNDERTSILGLTVSLKIHSEI